jgi:hypothetical protein
MVDGDLRTILGDNKCDGHILEVEVMIPVKEFMRQERSSFWDSPDLSFLGVISSDEKGNIPLGSEGIPFGNLQILNGLYQGFCREESNEEHYSEGKFKAHIIIPEGEGNRTANLTLTYKVFRLSSYILNQ